MRAFPVIVAGAGVVLSDAVDECRELAEKLVGAPVANSYLHNDSFPASHPLAVGPLGYQGWESAMQLVQAGRCDLGPGHPTESLQHPCPSTTSSTGRVRRRSSRWIRKSRTCWGSRSPLTSVSAAMRSAVAEQLLEPRIGRPRPPAPRGSSEPSESRSSTTRSAWLAEVWRAGTTRKTMPGAPGTRGRDRMSRRRWPLVRCCERSRMACPDDAMVSTDIGNICAMANSYLPFERPRSFLRTGHVRQLRVRVSGSIMGAKLACPDPELPVGGTRRRWRVRYLVSMSCRPAIG